MENAALIDTILRTVNTIGAWPLTAIAIIILIGPWITLIFIIQGQNRALQEMRNMHREVIGMYTNNVELVKGYEQLSGSLQEIILLNTQKITELVEMVKNNNFCPIIRKNKGEI
ncbi:hypothetical protein MCHI_002198 [Candidatus Magnetoovum chiemensis]|nr:hypothetical protein MCHI_002198 [Candidatus Magnetoovum chiemensis]